MTSRPLCVCSVGSAAYYRPRSLSDLAALMTILPVVVQLVSS